MLRVKKVKSYCFSDEQNPREVFFATSEAACVLPASHKAFGDSKTNIFGQMFCVSANTWEFCVDEKKIIANDNLTVFLDCDREEYSNKSHSTIHVFVIVSENRGISVSGCWRYR
jgi:hypothetical protein